jgi:hypothetical protein
MYEQIAGLMGWKITETWSAVCLHVYVCMCVRLSGLRMCICHNGIIVSRLLRYLQDESPQRLRREK